MSYCQKCGQELTDGERHCFAGWGFYVVYCEDCCPREVDGTECDKHEDAEEQAKK